jgi:hypothetical protein
VIEIISNAHSSVETGTTDVTAMPVSEIIVYFILFIIKIAYAGITHFLTWAQTRWISEASACPHPILQIILR